MTPAGSFVARTVRGTPRRVRGRTFTPVARVISRVQHRGTVGTAGVSAQGGGLVIVRPAALIEERDGGEHAWPIRDRTGLVLRQMLLAATLVAAVSLSLILFNWLTRKQ
jgi:hypothetical protein